MNALNVHRFHDSGFELYVDTQLDPLVSWLPVFFTILEPVFYVGSTTDPQLVSIKVDDMAFMLNEPTPVKTPVQINFENTKSLNQFLQKVIHKDDDMDDLLITSTLKVKLFGTVWYRHLYCKKRVSLKKKEPSDDSTDLKKVMSNSTSKFEIPKFILRKDYDPSMLF